MKTLLVILIFIISCNFPQNKERRCIYHINNLFESYDSGRFEINRDEGLTEVIDSVKSTGERGIYKFDENGILRFYGYLVNTDNDYYFGIEYDSAGHEINKPRSHVVRWFVSKLGNDSLKLTFLLFDINRSYGGVTLRGINMDRKVPLFKSLRFSNLIGGDIIFPIPQDKTIYIKGFVKNSCNSEFEIFKDSVYIPREVLE